MLLSRYTDRVTIPPGIYVIGFNATARVGATSAAIAIDDVVLRNGSCDIQGSTAVHYLFVNGVNVRTIRCSNLLSKIAAILFY